MNTETTQDNTPATDIFEEVKHQQTEVHRKLIKQARSTLYLIAIYQIISSLLIAFTQETGTVRTVEIIAGVIIAGIYTGLGYYSRKKTFIAFLIGLILYVTLLILTGVNDPAALLKGAVFKFFIIAALIRGLIKARSLDKLDSINSPV
jgi:hypothetical protein